MSVLAHESASERRVISSVRTELRNLVEANSSEQVAMTLDIDPQGVRSLLLQDWPLEKAFRVAEALELDLSRIVGE